MVPSPGVWRHGGAQGRGGAQGGAHGLAALASTFADGDGAPALHGAAEVHLRQAAAAVQRRW